MKSDRLLSLLLMLQSRPQRTAAELAHALEVSTRTIYRDVESLALAGVPVYARRGSDGGIALSEGYRRTLTHFDEDEVRALFVTDASALADLGLDRGLDRALDKLRATMSEPHRRAAEHARARIVLDQRRWYADDTPRETLAVLRRAVWDDRRVRFAYADRGGKLSQRYVEPFGLVGKTGIWYLVARDDQEYRTFRVDRMQNVRETADRFERPPDFDLDAHWKAGTARLTQRWPSNYEAIVMLDRAVVEGGMHWEHAVVGEGDGTLRVHVRFPGPDAAVYQCVAWGEHVRIEQPPELRERILAAARAIVLRYGTERGASRDVARPHPRTGAGAAATSAAASTKRP